MMSMGQPMLMSTKSTAACSSISCAHRAKRVRETAANLHTGWWLGLRLELGLRRVLTPMMAVLHQETSRTTLSCRFDTHQPET